MGSAQKVPSLKAREVIKVLQKFGFRIVRQKGSHVILHKHEHKTLVVIPNHPNKNLKKPLLKKIIEKDAGISIGEFLKLLKGKK